MTQQENNYTKWLSEIGLNYQNPYQAAMSRLIGGPGNFTKQEAVGTVQAAVNSYCDSHSNLEYS
jgi:hypothetical protein